MTPATDSDSLDLTYGAASARRRRIVELVQERTFCSVAELSELLGVSDMTVRRDLRRLHVVGLLRSVHGGASAPAPVIGDFEQRDGRNMDQKLAIARRAAALVKPHAVVAFDAGTTTPEIARELPAGLPLSAVTHSLPVMAALAGRPNVQLIGLGGLFHNETRAFAGPATLTELQQMRVQLVFLGASSIHDGALYCGNPLDAELKKALIERADRVVLVSDASKFRLTALLPVAPLSSIDCIVVDDGMTDGDRAMLRAARVEIVEVAVRGANGGGAGA